MKTKYWKAVVNELATVFKEYTEKVTVSLLTNPSTIQAIKHRRKSETIRRSNWLTHAAP
jgi:hypothetical protein